jgi:hypothetical protein
MHFKAWILVQSQAKMKQWNKKEIEVAGGAKVLAQVPLIVSASCSTEMRL